MLVKTRAAEGSMWQGIRQTRGERRVINKKGSLVWSRGRIPHPLGPVQSSMERETGYQDFNGADGPARAITAKLHDC
jgi:hypothetical protein